MSEKKVKKVLVKKPKTKKKDTKGKKIIMDKKDQTLAKDKWDYVKTRPGDFITQYSSNPDIIANVIKEAGDLYHNDGESPISDAVWDLLHDWLKTNHPDHSFFQTIGADIIEGEAKKKVELPFHMGSMDKIKPDSGALERWQKKHLGSVLVTTKLDGVSFLLTYNCSGKEKKGVVSNFTLYTRGNGTYGGDITNLLQYMPSCHKSLKAISDSCDKTASNLTLRGEIIMSRKKFDSKYSYDKGTGTFKNARNLVAGIVNSKKIQIKILKDIDLVCYEVLEPRSKPSDQFRWMKSMRLQTAMCHLATEKKYDADSLSQDLLNYRSSSPYEIDGLVVLHDKLYPINSSGNPKNAFAFKTLLQHDRAETTVFQVEWNASKNGFLKPRITVEAVKLDGVTIHHVTGFNAKFIQDEGIGPGAKVVLVRSGGVIPHIVEVTTRVEPSMPLDSYEWTKGNVDIVLSDIEGDEEVILKQLIHFFQKIDTKHVGPGITKKLMDYVISKEEELGKTEHIRYPKVLYLILTLTLEEIQTLEGFQGKLAEKTYTQIHDSLHKAGLVKIMAASQMCGRGIGERRLNMLFKEIPDLLQLVKTQKHGELVDRICQIEGFQTTTAIPFVDKLPSFLQFYQEICKLDPGRATIEKAVEKTAQQPVKKGHLSGRIFVFTGVRDDSCKQYLLNNGADVVGSFTSKVTDLITKDKSSNSRSMIKAKEKGLPIHLVEEALKL